MAGEANEKCGVFGVYGPGLPVAELTQKGLYVLGHRGQQGAGISVSDGENIMVSSNLGKVEEVFPDSSSLSGLLNPDDRIIGTGHTLYSTSKNDLKARDSLQPFFYGDGELHFTLAHNGNIPDFGDLPAEYGLDGEAYASDTHLLLQLIGAEVSQTGGDMRQALKNLLPRIIGAYSLVLSTPTEMFAARDPQGFRPHQIGRIADKGWVFASETAALDIVDSEPFGELEPGTIAVVSNASDSGLSIERFADAKPALCGFEFIYFSRPDNEMYGELTLKVRERMGELMARRDYVEADIVVGVPASGMSFADGYARARGLLHEKAVARNNAVPRTFIKGTQEQRDEAVHNKLNPIKRLIKDKRIIVADDSIVRGTTTKALVKMFRKAGAKEVHLRISSPPYSWPCFYGMDTGNRAELIASQMSTEELCEYLGADSLMFLTNEEVQVAVGAAAGKICTACTTGIYPVATPVKIGSKRPQQLAEPAVA